MSKAAAWLLRNRKGRVAVACLGIGTGLGITQHGTTRHLDRPQLRDSRTNDNHLAGRRDNHEDQISRGTQEEDSSGEGFRDGPTSAAELSTFGEAKAYLSQVKWGSLGDRVVDMVAPAWIHEVPGWLSKVQSEMSMGPGSLADEIWQEALDPSEHPEIDRHAAVRVSHALCDGELQFRRARQQHTARALARYLAVPEHEMHPEDVPVIGICGSGGGLRALVSGAGSYLCTQEAGLFDCSTYTAGLSGSCWLQVLFNSSIGKQDFGRVLRHLKRRLDTHIAYPPAILDMLTQAPTNKYLLAGVVERLRGESKAPFGIVDIYGILLGARLLVPQNELIVEADDLKLSGQMSYLGSGQAPLPIYAAVRHELPELEDLTSKIAISEKAKQEIEAKVEKEAWFQWFEFTPMEFWCEDFASGIPAWAIGRHFEAGETVTEGDAPPLPELRLPFLMGIWGSAFCATLAHYYKEVRPMIKGLLGFDGFDQLLRDRNDDLVRLHPIEPGSIRNFAKGMHGVLPASCPRNVPGQDYLELMDAGMSNNLPIYPLLRQSRDVDVIVCFDASANVAEENWLSVAGKYLKERNITGWPYEAGWSKRDDGHQMIRTEIRGPSKSQTSGGESEGREKTVKAGVHSDRKESSQSKDLPTTSDMLASQSEKPTDLGYCNIWVGSTAEDSNTDGSTKQQGQSKCTPENLRSRAQSSDAGLTLIYFPFMPNPKVPDVNPDTSPFLSTWNFVYTKEEIDKVVALARANFEEGQDQIKEAIRAVYERKKAKRVKYEMQSHERRWTSRFEDHDHNHFR